MTLVLLTSASGASWSRPDNWTDAGHTVNLLGAGGRGGTSTTGTSARSGPGGGGGAHVLLTRTAGTLGSSVDIRITSDNASLTDRTTTSATLWGATTFANTRYVESGEGGGAGGTDTAGGIGGSATTTSTGTPTVPTYTASQGNAGGTGGATAAVVGSGAGGAGAGGPTGIGANGGPCITASRGGGGGGGANNGTVGGGTSASATGANGGNGPGGSGGGAGSASGTGTAGTTNTGGGGGGGFFAASIVTTSGGAGGDDDIWTQTSDSATEGPGGGGGGGGGNSTNSAGATTNGGNGGNYGAGGGGAGGARSGTSTRTAGTGASGLIVITYTQSPLSIAGSFSGAGSLSANIRPGTYVDIHPDADDTDGGWTTDTGGTSLFAAIDETASPNDSDYIQSTNNPTVDICRVRLTDPTGTLVAPVTVRVRAKSDGTNIDLTTRLKEGSTIIAEWVDEDLPTTFTTFAHELLQAEVDAIGDPTNLFIEFESNLVFDAETTAWAAAVAGDGGTVSSARLLVVNDLIAGLKQDGIFAKLDRLWLQAAEDEQGALRDIVAAASATKGGTPAFVADRGYTGRGATFADRIDSNFNPTTAPSPKAVRDSGSYFFWSNTNVASTTEATLGITGTSTVLYPRTGSNNLLWRINAGSNINTPNSNGLGLFHGNRSGASAQEIYVNGSLFASDTAASIAIPSANIGFLCAALATSTSSWPGQICCGGFGESLNATEAANLYSRLRTYMTAVGVP